MSDAVPLLSLSRARAIHEHLARAAERARSAGTPVLWLYHERLDDVPPLLDVFTAAESSNEPRFYATRPSESLELVAVGRAAQRTCASEQPFEELLEFLRAELVAPPGVSTDPEHAATQRHLERAWWVGGFAFDPARTARAPHWAPFGSAHFTLPELAIRREGGDTWLTIAGRIEPEADPSARMARWARWLAKASATPSSEQRRPLTAQDDALRAYRDAVARALEAIRAGRAEKVVLACEERHRLYPGWRPSRALQSLSQAHPGSLTFAHGVGASTFLGASPELLIRRRGTSLASAAVAATTRRDPSKAEEAALAEALRSSRKELGEHRWVVDALRRALTPLCNELTIPDTPAILHAGALQHLHTPVSGVLRRPCHILELAARLHPTPALGGHPHTPALELIRAHEGFDRGGYAGPIGWLNAEGDGELCVALRCALADPHGLRLFAGSGIVAESTPECEMQETRLKLRSIREVLDLW